uniref:(northern house mosquito) hypothetical protein n=1 Tax=Culex pipiens TaxID=7175 RepID=A0A8D8CNE2_CULPI
MKSLKGTTTSPDFFFLLISLICSKHLTELPDYLKLYESKLRNLKFAEKYCIKWRFHRVFFIKICQLHIIEKFQKCVFIFKIPQQCCQIFNDLIMIFFQIPILFY